MNELELPQTILFAPQPSKYCAVFGVVNFIAHDDFAAR